MADTKFSQFSLASALSGSDVLVGLQSAINVQATLSQVLTYINANAQITESQVTNLVSDLAAKLDLSGANSPMTGFLTLNADPVSNLQAVTKQYVDNLITPGEYLKVVNNLSDVANIFTSATNLGVGNLYTYITGSTVLSAPLPRRIGFNISAPGQTLQLPNATNLNTNVVGDIFFLDNYSAYDVQILDGSGSPIYLIKSGTKVFYTPDSNLTIAGIWNFWPWIGSVNNSSLYNNIVDLNSAYGQTASQNLTISSGLNLLGGSLNIGGPSISSNSLLSLTSTTQGMLPPRMTTAQMNAIPVTPSDAGLQVYVTDETNGYYYFDGTSWVYISNSSSAGDTLQAAYNAGNTISLSISKPLVVSNQSGLSNFIYLYSPGAPAPYNYDSLEGMQFTPNVDVYVTALQYVNQYFPSGARQVGIFRTSDQSLIVSDLVYKTDPLDPTGKYRTHAINPVLLSAGVSYLVVCIVPANENWTFYSISNPPDFNWTAVTYAQNASVITYPTTITPGGAVYGNQNFQYSTATSIASFNDGTQQSILSLSSTTQGFLQPVMTVTQRNSISSPPSGLSIYNNTYKTQDYYTGTQWQNILTTQNINGTGTVTVTDNGDGTVTITGSGSPVPDAAYASFSIQNNTVATTFGATSTFYPVYLSNFFSGSDASDFTNQFLTISSISTPVMTYTGLTTQFFNVNINLSCRGAVPSSSSYTFSIYIRLANGTIVPTQYRNTLTLQDLINYFDASLTGNIQLNTGDSVFIEVQNITSTNSLYVAYATASITSVAGSISNTNGLPQGSTNLYLSQDAGSTYEYMSGSATIGNYAAFNTTGGQLIDSGIAVGNANSVNTTVNNTNSNFYLPFVSSSSSGYQALNINSNFNYNPLAGVLTVPNLILTALSANQLLGLNSGKIAVTIGAGTSTTVLHGNASGLPTYSAVSLVNDITGTLGFGNGGFGFSTATTGDIFLATGTNTPGKLSDVATGSVLVSGGVGVAPSYSSSPTLTGLTLSALTPGSVIFSGTSGVISQNNGSLFWDNTNGAFGIGTSTFDFTGINLEIKNNSVSGANAVIRTTLTGSGNQAALYLSRGDATNGNALVRFITGAAGSGSDWDVGIFNSGIATNTSFVFRSGVTNWLTLSNAGVMNLSQLTASQAVVTNGSKDLVSLAYTSANTVSTLVQRDGSGNFSAGTITASLSGTATNATNVTTTQVSNNATYFPCMFPSSTNGNQPCDLSTGLTFNPSTLTLNTPRIQATTTLQVGGTENDAPLTVLGSGGTSGTSVRVAYIGSPVGGGTVAANFYQLTINKSGTQSLLLGVNKNSTTGDLPADCAYISSYTTNGPISIGRGASNELPNSSDILIDGSGNVSIKNGNLNVSNLTASYPVVTDGSKNLKSANTASVYPFGTSTATLDSNADTGMTIISNNANTVSQFAISNSTKNNFIMLWSGRSGDTNPVLMWSGSTNLRFGTCTAGAFTTAGYTNLFQMDSNGDFEVVAGNLKLNAAGKTIQLATGTNACRGTATMSTGSATVSTTAAGTGNMVIVTGTGANSYGCTITNGVGFSITSSNILDGTTVNWVLIK